MKICILGEKRAKIVNSKLVLIIFVKYKQEGNSFWKSTSYKINILFSLQSLIQYFLCFIFNNNILGMIRLIHKSFRSTFCSSKTGYFSKTLVDYQQRGQFRGPLNLKVGDKVNDFEVIQKFKLPDFQINCVVLKCSKWSTEWIHLDCEQQKNTFALVTKCKDVPHLVKISLQKMLQCGSKKYPVRNPIEYMTRRSFNPENFSFTTSDYIFYGYQTTLLKDHHNLMEVFLNMMYNPLLRVQDFYQIVWRYQLKGDNKLEIQGDVAAQLKGMQVLSEMKIFDAIMRELLGRKGVSKPEQVMELTYQEMARWHKDVFHPKNLLILSHGDLHPASIINKYRDICTKFQFPNLPPQSKNGQKINNLQQSKTVHIQHLQANVPLILSFKIEDISTEHRILLSVLSMILHDMPDSVMMRWNTTSTPYPKHYGFQGNYFNIGITINQAQKKYGDKQFIAKEKQMRDCLAELYKNKISNLQIEKCLLQLQSQYYTRDGVKLITGCLDNIVELGSGSIEESLNVKSFVSKILRTYRESNIFEELLRKYILENKSFIRIYGQTNKHLVQDNDLSEIIRLRERLQKMKDQQLNKIKEHRATSILQDYRILPKIQINEYEIFEEKSPSIFAINGISTYHCHKCDGVKIVLKYDVTDLEQDQIKLIPIICASYPWMGAKGITPQAFLTYTDMYIKNIQMKFETMRTNEGMKLFMFLSTQFSDRNAQFCFNLLTNLINDHYYDNYEILSQAIQRKASQNYNSLSQKLIEIHGIHLGGTRSPYAMLQDPLFAARSICTLASDILKVSDSKQILQQLAAEMKSVTEKFKDKSRIQVLIQCKNTSLERYRKYIETLLSNTRESNTKMQKIADTQFTPTNCMKYFPNYQQEYVFQAFSVPYYQSLQQVPATLVLSAMINSNIRRFNLGGGSFLFKGSLISYLRGSRKKLIQLEQYYKKIEDINEAKRSIFQQFYRYTSSDIFYTGVKAEEARIFKQAVASVNQTALETCLQKYLLKSIKEGKSSILSLGPHLGSYQPLIKKGWAIQRSIQDMSLQMQSVSTAIPQIETSKYINIY